MQQHNIDLFIQKAIEKTKKEKLSWKTLDNNFTVKPIPQDKAVISIPETYTLSTDLSFFSNFENGQILLLVYALPLMQFTPMPPSNCILTLRVQDDTSPFAVEISNTNDDLYNANTLLRLYNLISHHSNSINTLINDFLNS